MANKYLEKIASAEREYTDKEIARKHTFKGMSDKTLRHTESLDDFYHVTKHQSQHAGIGTMAGAAIGALIGHGIGRGHPAGSILGFMGGSVGGGMAGAYHGALAGVRERIDHGQMPHIKNTRD
jgi:outer membrane lipoprotein SlyB